MFLVVLSLRAKVILGLFGIFLLLVALNALCGFRSTKNYDFYCKVGK
jgi:hypothetical protein